MGVDLGKGEGSEHRLHPTPHRPEVQHGAQDHEGTVARTTPPPAPYQQREPSAPVLHGDRGLNVQAMKLFTGAWTAGWIVMFATGRLWFVGLVMLLMQGAVFGYVKQNGLPWAGVNGQERRARRLERHRARGERRAAAKAAALPPPPPVVPDALSVAESRLAGALVRAETSGGRIDGGSVEMVREVERLLRPLLSQLRTRQADPQVRHDVETLAGEHLPRTIDDFLVLPDDYAREHRGPTGTTPADELRAQLQLLVEGCKQLRDSVLAADVDRQQQQSRFLEAKFRRSDLDL